ncbi:MAG TPA: response regulator transcription factor [Micromonosporaceae bacterium]
MSQPRVLVVDDDEPIAAALRRALEYEGCQVRVVHDGVSALAEARSGAPDLMVLDLMLPGLDGVTVCQRLRAERIDTLVLMLTARDATADRVRGLDAGADDYLAKPFAYEELLARVRALLRRRGGPAHGQLSLADLTLDPTAYEVRRGDRLIDLTAQEFQLLGHFLRHPRQVLSRAQLLESVWGLPAASASNVVDVYVGYLRAKLEAGGEPRLLHTVRGVGYVLKAL